MKQNVQYGYHRQDRNGSERKEALTFYYPQL